jgi:hypothetical protein
MSRRRCCCSVAQCGSCASLPSDWSTRDYRLFIPTMKPVTYGRLSSAPSGLYTGPCVPSDAYWSLAECGFNFATGAHYELGNKRANCVDPIPEYCADVITHAREIGGFSTDNLVPSITYNTETATRFYNLTGGVGINAWSIEVTINRCIGLFLPSCVECTNRTRISIRYGFFNQSNYNDGCSTVLLTGVNSYVFLGYLSNPYTLAEGIGKTCYLRYWSIERSGCAGETGARQCDDVCALGPCSFFGSSNFPSTVTIT